jgi:uncharacterized membrane protein
MDAYLLLKAIHIISAAVLFGTGLGIAFFMWRADRSGDVAAIAATARQVVLADWLFTAPAVIVQPVTGYLLAIEAGYALNERWLLLSAGLYVLTGACWLPVVWLQFRMKTLAEAARDQHAPLPAAYRRAMRLWFALGWPAFGAVIAIFFLMVFRPAL